MKVFQKGLFALFVGLISFNVAAQEYADAVNLYNEGLNQARDKQYEQAIASFTRAMDIGEQLGDDQGSSIKSQAEKQIPKMYYQKAVVSFNTFRTSKSMSDLNTAIEDFLETSDVAKELGDSDITQRAASIIPQLYYQKGTLFYGQEDFESANEALDAAINSNANYAIAYYQKGLVAKKIDSDDVDGFLSWFDRAIDVAERTSDNRVARTVKTAAYDDLLYRGVKLSENKQYSAAVDILKLALTYDEEGAGAHYRLAEVYNKQGNADLAIEAGNKALQFEKGGRTDKAKIYFEIGTAYQTKGNVNEACNAFQEALYGSFKAPASHIMEFELKCKVS